MTAKEKQEYRDNWKKYYPPTIPIYYVEIDALKDLLEKNPRAISDVGFELMIGAFEELEMYEKAAVIKPYMNRRKPLIQDEDVPDLMDIVMEDEEDGPPDDGQEWQIDERTGAWIRPATQDEIDELFKKNKKKDDDKRDDGDEG